MAEQETSPLLAKLLATVNDERLFDMSGTGDPDAWRERAREIFRALYSNAAGAWDFLVYGDLYADDDPQYPGVLLFEEYDELVGCPIEEFRDAIRFVADGRVETREGEEIAAGGTPAAGEDDREFLYFMIGYAALGRQEAIRSGRFTGGRNYRKQD